MADIRRVWQANMQVYGARKIWHQLQREGVTVARCTVERLMRQLGLQGARRGKIIRTTVVRQNATCPSDLVNRTFHANRPNQLWVSDFHLCINLAGLVVRGFCYRCICPPHRWLACQQHHEYGFCA